jgi:ATP-dependent Clp protease adapter protein ClpS
MTSVFQKLRTTLSSTWDDFRVAMYANTVYEYAERRGLLPVTVETLTRFIALDEPPERVRSLLAAYAVKIDLAALNPAPTAGSGTPKDFMPETMEVIIHAYYIARLSRGSRKLQPVDVFVSLAKHPASAHIIAGFGLTPLQVTYFLSHGRTLPATHADELPNLRAREGDVVVRISNDDYTPMELVTRVFTEVFELDGAQARETMLKIHREREAFMGPYAYGDARTKAMRAIVMAREAGAPLLLSLATPNAASQNL